MLKENINKYLNKLNLKFLYGLIFGIFGFPVAFFASEVIFGGAMKLIWIIFRESPKPLWPLIVLPIIFLISFIGLSTIIIRKGVEYGTRLELDQNQDFVKKQAQKRLWLGLFILLVYISFLLYNLDVYENKEKTEKKGKNEKYSQALKEIRDIRSVLVEHKKDGLEVSVGIEGKSKGKYLLTVELIATGYVKAKLKGFIATVYLKHEKQIFDFYIPFEELARLYTKEFKNFVPSLESNMVIDEYITALVKLRLMETEGITSDEVYNLNLPSEKKISLIRLFFKCSKESCEIEQLSKDNKEGIGVDFSPNMLGEEIFSNL